MSVSSKEPPVSFDMVLRADGASKGNPGPAGAGAVLIGPDGSVKAEISEPLGRATNNEAEYQALILGMEEALRQGAATIQVQMDSELVVKQMQGLYRVKSPGLAPYWQRARALARRFTSVRFVAVPRTENAMADQLASVAALLATEGNRCSTDAGWLDQEHRLL